MARIEKLVQIKSINIDFPFAQTIRRLDGNLATSVITIKEMIDRAVSLGFNTISFDTNVPINIQTGELQLKVEGSSDGDKSFSEEVWKGIQYAESIGLRTIIDLNIRNALNDVQIQKSSVSPTFNTDQFFSAVKTFETDIAKKAQEKGVDGITIGAFNFGYDTAEYQSKWADIITSIRQIYQGTLRYSSHEFDIDNPLWRLVDEIQIQFGPKWALQPDFSAEDFVTLYLGPYIAGDKTTSTLSAHARVGQLLERYPEKLISLEVTFPAGQSAGNEFANPWGYVFSEDPLLENANDQKNLKVFPESFIDTKLNSQKVAGFLEYFGNYLKDRVSGIQFWQYAPWTEANWLRQPQTHENKVWQSVVRANGMLNWDPEAEKTIGEYLSRGWGFTTLHHGTDKAEQLRGSEVADKFFGSAGNDSMDGGLGLDTVNYKGKLIEYAISRSTNLVSIEKSGVGRDRLVDVERLIFDDQAVALDTDKVAGQAYRIYKAAFNRIPDTGGLGYWIAQMDKGMNAVDVSARFIDSPEFRTLYGQNPSNADFLTKVYSNVLGRTPDQGGYSWWLNELNTNPARTKAKVLADFAESGENQAGVASLIGNGIQYTEFVG